ncbi:MAG: class I SAM-dependent methyltransferase [Isosphaeraceae bacterium]
MSAGLALHDSRYFDRLADVELNHWWSHAMWRMAQLWLDSALQGRHNLIAADVGCGTGLTAARLAAQPGIATVIGLDPSRDALDHALLRHRGPLLRGSALALPFPDRSLDLVTAFDVLQHTDDRRALVEFRRVLRDGGLLLLRVNGRGWSGDASTYTRGGLADLLKQSGFTLRRLSHANAVGGLVQEVRGRVSRILAGAADGVRAHPTGGGLVITVPSRWVNQLMRAVGTVEATLVGRLKWSLPFGHSTLALAEKPAS